MRARSELAVILCMYTKANNAHSTTSRALQVIVQLHTLIPFRLRPSHTYFANSQVLLNDIQGLWVPQ